MIWLERVWQDIRYGARMLAGHPGFTLVAMSSLAIGIGANSAAFSWADALLLRPLTVPRPGEVVTVGTVESVQEFARLAASYREYVDIRDRATSFEGLTAFSGMTAGLTTSPDALPKLTLGLVVTGNFFKVLGVEPDMGRGFRPEEDQVPGRDAVVVLGHTFWQRQFGADPSMVGRRLKLNGVEFTVIGVTPERFTGTDQFVRRDFFVPIMMWPRLMNDPNVRPLDARDFRDVTIKGRLKVGMTLARAQSELSVIASDLARAYPATNRHRGLAVQTELQRRAAQSPPDTMLVEMLHVLAAAVLFVACANVAGLLTSRAPVRAGEMATRLALGAGRPRLIRQLLTESLLIGIGGGILGLAVGFGAMRVFQRIHIPTDLPVLLDFRLDRRALLFGLGAAIASVGFFGLVPAIQTSRADLINVIKGTGAAAGKHGRRGRSVLVAGQVAVSVVLLVLATFMYRGFRRELATGPGYHTDRLLMMSLDPSLVRYKEAETRRFFLELAERARSLPDVKAAALTSSVPMATDGLNAATIVPEGYQLPAGTENLTVFSARVDEQYFETIGIPIIRGRGFTAQDAAGTPRVAVVNELAAQRYWPAQDPIGRRFQLVERGATIPVEIIGVAKMSKYVWLAEAPTAFVYLPYRQDFQSEMVLLTASIGDSTTLVTPLRHLVQSLDRRQPIFNVRTMEEFYQMRTITIFHTIIGTIGAMGAMGLALAIVGLYGLVAYSANRRTREIGIRMAIGAGRPMVLRLVLREGIVLAIAGLVIGLAGGMGAQRLLQATFPSGDNGLHPMALVLVAPLVFTVTLLAAYIPARRASRLDPMKALRDQ